MKCSRRLWYATSVPSIRRKRVTRVTMPKTTLDLVIIDEKRAMTNAIDVTIPCLVALIENQPLIIDDWHRLFKSETAWL